MIDNAVASRLPDIRRPDAPFVTFTEAPFEEEFAIPDPRPKGLLTLNRYLNVDGTTVATYAQWAQQPPAGEPAYRLYRSERRPGVPEPGCIVMVTIEFETPDHDRLRRWADLVFEAMAEETEPPAGGIGAHFHLSTDGMRVLNYAEWTSAEAHIAALEASGQGTIGRGPKWLALRRFPGLKKGEARRYRFDGSWESTEQSRSERSKT